MELSATGTGTYVLFPQHSDGIDGVTGRIISINPYNEVELDDWDNMECVFTYRLQSEYGENVSLQSLAHQMFLNFTAEQLSSKKVDPDTEDPYFIVKPNPWIQGEP